jgi:putative hydrolase of the HAD superfamily
VLKKHKLLLFDLDDTLLYSDWFKKGMLQTIAGHPLTKNLDAALFLEKKLRVPKELIDRLKKREYTPMEFRRARWLHAFAHFDLTPNDKLIDEIDTLFVKTGLSTIEQNPHLNRLLLDLRSHYEIAIVTNALYDPRQKVAAMGLSELFTDETIFHGEELGLRKPDQELYLAPLKYFGRTRDETLFIGDSWIHDVAGPIDCGMDAIWINVHGVDQPSGHSPFAVVPDVMGIRDVLLK